VLQVVSREFDTSQGPKGDPNKNDASTNFGRDLPEIVKDHQHFIQIATDRMMVRAGPEHTLVTRGEVLRQIRKMLSVREDVDVFYLIYTGHTQKLTGRWVCTDGFIDLYDVLDLWEHARAKSAANGGFPRARARLVIICDNPNSGAWVEQHRAALAARMPPAAAGPFPYCLSNPEIKRPGLEKARARTRSRSRGRSRGCSTGGHGEGRRAAGEGAAAAGEEGAASSPGKPKAASPARVAAGAKLPFVVCGGGQRGGSPSMVDGGPRARQAAASVSPPRPRRSLSPGGAAAAAGGGDAAAAAGDGGSSAVKHAAAFVVTGGGQRGGSTCMVPGGPRRHRDDEGRGRRGDASVSPDGGRGGGESFGGEQRELGPGMAIGDYDKIAGVQEAARVTAVMSSCGPTERALETSDGGAFFSCWARHPVQGKLGLQGVALSAPQIRAPGAGCRQHPMLSVGWCLSPADGDPLLLPAGVGLYLTGPSFYVP